MMKKETYIKQRNRAVEQAVKLAEGRGHIDKFLAKDVYLYLEDTLAYVNELNEPKKPVIPQFVADYIEKYKDDGLPIQGWFSFKTGERDVEGWIYANDSFEESKKREWLLIDAIRHGYEIEQEKKYYVLDHEGETMLYKVLSQGVAKTSGCKPSEVGKFLSRDYTFTESEIKAVDERYWAFAFPVEEVEE